MNHTIRINGRDHKVKAQILNGQLWVQFNGQTFCVENEVSKRSKKSSAGGASSDKVISPMPGKVTKVFVAAGDKVSKGQAVLVMEAMKMEYTLKVEQDGEVDSIGCQVGEQVQLGKLLLKLK